MPYPNASRAACVVRVAALAIAAILGGTPALALAERLPPFFDIDEVAQVFGAAVARSQGSFGSGIAEVRTTLGTFRQEVQGGEITTTLTQPALDPRFLAQQSGAVVTRHARADGVEVVEFRRGRTVLRQERRDGRVLATQVVQAGNAALCLREIFIGDLVAMDLCHSALPDGLRDSVVHGLDAISVFAADNSLFPLTPAQSRLLTANRLRQFVGQGARIPPDAVRQFCTTGEGARTLKDLAETSPAQVQRQVQDATSVPEPPLLCTGF